MGKDEEDEEEEEKKGRERERAGWNGRGGEERSCGMQPLLGKQIHSHTDPEH